MYGPLGMFGVKIIHPRWGCSGLISITQERCVQRQTKVSWGHVLSTTVGMGARASAGSCVSAASLGGARDTDSLQQIMIDIRRAGAYERLLRYYSSDKIMKQHCWVLADYALTSNIVFRAAVAMAVPVLVIMLQLTINDNAASTSSASSGTGSG